MRLRADRYSERCKEGQLRNKAWRKLSPTEQLKVIDARLGAETGAKKQRAQIAAKLT